VMLGQNGNQCRYLTIIDITESNIGLSLCGRCSYVLTISLQG
jgi:hypothetical protein